MHANERTLAEHLQKVAIRAAGPPATGGFCRLIVRSVSRTGRDKTASSLSRRGGPVSARSGGRLPASPCEPSPLSPHAVGSAAGGRPSVSPGVEGRAAGGRAAERKAGCL